MIGFPPISKFPQWKSFERFYFLRIWFLPYNMAKLKAQIVTNSKVKVWQNSTLNCDITQNSNGDKTQKKKKGKKKKKKRRQKMGQHPKS